MECSNSTWSSENIIRNLEAMREEKKMAIRNCDLLKAIREKYYDLGQDFEFIDKCCFHFQKLEPFAKEHFKSRQEYNECLLSKMFFDKLDFYENRPKLTPERKEYRAPLVPFESCLFNLDNPLTKERRMKKFYQGLIHNDILILKMIGYVNEEYVFKVLAKHGDYKKIDDLNIHAHLPKGEDEMKILGEEIKESDIIRGGVKEGRNALKIILTVDEKIFNGEEVSVKLGKVPETDFSLSLDTDSGTNFHIIAQPASRIPSISFETYKMLGLDPYKTYSFNKKFHNQTCDHKNSGKELIQQMKIRSSNSSLKVAVEYSESENYLTALEHFDQCLKEWPNNLQAYVKRGKMYQNMLKHENAGLNQKAVLDWEKILDLSESMESFPLHYNKDYFDALLMSAKRYIIEKNFDKAQECIEGVLSYNQKDQKAIQIMNVLNRKKEKYLKSLLDQPLDALEKRKKELVKKLKIIEGSNKAHNK